MLYEKALILAKIESVLREDALPTPEADALLVEDPQVSLDITQLTRNNVRVDLSPLATVAGRKVAKLTFKHEVRNNGNLLGTVSPIIGRLIRACGFAETQITGLATIGAVVAGLTNVGAIDFAKAGAYTGTMPREVTITITEAGGSGVAKASVVASAIADLPEVSSVVTLTDTITFTLADGAQLTPTFGSDVSVGDTWTLVLTPAGFEYTPVSEDFESITIYAYFDGLLHKMHGGAGTWSVEGTGGDYAKFTFEFTGDYVAVQDVPMPTNPAYETQKPVYVELANLSIGGSADFACSKFTVTMANDVQIKDNINASNAYAGAQIVGRKPTVSFDPEAVLEASHPFWGNLSSGEELTFAVRVGTKKGNVVRFEAPNVQYTNLGYGNRNSQRTYDVTANVARRNGNDEMKVCFN